LMLLLYVDGPPRGLFELSKSPVRRALGTDAMTSLRCILELLPRSKPRLRNLLSRVNTFREFELAIAEFRRSSREMTSIDRLKSSDPFSRPSMRSSQTLAQASITSGRTFSASSLESRRMVSATLPSLTEIVCVDSEANSSNMSSSSTIVRSQCSTKFMRFQMNKNLPETSWTSCTSSPVDVTDADATRRNSHPPPAKSTKGVTLLPETEENQKKCRVPLKQGPRKGEACGVKAVEDEARCKLHMKTLLSEEVGQLRCVRFRVHENIHMRKLLPQWFGACRMVYNRAIDSDPGMDISAINLKKNLVTGQQPELWMNDCPNHLRSEVIRDYVAARKSALALYEKKIWIYRKRLERWEQQGQRWKKPVEPKKPVMKHRTKKQVRSVITIPKTDIKMEVRGFRLLYTHTLKRTCLNGGRHRKDSHLLTVNSKTWRKDKKFLQLLGNGGPKHDVRLIRYRNGRLFLEVPVDVQVSNLPILHAALGIDPGLRTPLVCAGTDGVIMEMGIEFKEHVKLLRSQKSQLQSAQSTRHGSKKRRIKEQMAKLDTKITNVRTQFHYEVIREVSPYQHVYLPRTNYAGWNRGLTRTSRRTCQEIAHPLLRNRLIAKSEILGGGRKIHDCDEYMTTKVCSKCFCVNDKIGSNEIFICPSCKVIFGRDQNAARNILLINLQP
jgi:transposase